MRDEAKLWNDDLESMERIDAYYKPMNLEKPAPARFALEYVIDKLLPIDFPDEEERSKVAVAEWWIRIVEDNGNITFHFDKDEALNGKHQIVKNPSESTVTYLTEGAGPTMIVNRTTPDGFAND